MGRVHQSDTCGTLSTSHRRTLLHPALLRKRRNARVIAQLCRSRYIQGNGAIAATKGCARFEPGGAGSIETTATPPRSHTAMSRHIACPARTRATTPERRCFPGTREHLPRPRPRVGSPHLEQPRTTPTQTTRDIRTGALDNTRSILFRWKGLNRPATRPRSTRSEVKTPPAVDGRHRFPGTFVIFPQCQYLKLVTWLPRSKPTSQDHSPALPVR